MIYKAQEIVFKCVDCGLEFCGNPEHEYFHKNTVGCGECRKCGGKRIPILIGVSHNIKFDFDGKGCATWDS